MARSSLKFILIGLAGLIVGSSITYMALRVRVSADSAPPVCPTNPRITSVAPASATWGTSITITGANLAGNNGTNVYIMAATGQKYQLHTFTVGEAAAGGGTALTFTLERAIGGPIPPAGSYQLYVETYKNVPVMYSTARMPQLTLDSNSWPFVLTQ